MDTRALVWPQNFLLNNQKLLIFVTHWRSAKDWTSEIKNKGVIVIFQVFGLLAFVDLAVFGCNIWAKGAKSLDIFYNYFPHQPTWHYSKPLWYKFQPLLMSQLAPIALKPWRVESDIQQRETAFSIGIFWETKLSRKHKANNNSKISNCQKTWTILEIQPQQIYCRNTYYRANGEFF